MKILKVKISKEQVEACKCLRLFSSLGFLVLLVSSESFTALTPADGNFACVCGEIYMIRVYTFKNM